MKLVLNDNSIAIHFTQPRGIYIKATEPGDYLIKGFYKNETDLFNDLHVSRFDEITLDHLIDSTKTKIEELDDTDDE